MSQLIIKLHALSENKLQENGTKNFDIKLIPKIIEKSQIIIHGIE